MLTLKWIIGLFCFLYPTRVEGVEWRPLVAQDKVPESAAVEPDVKSMVHADQKLCGTARL
jgi:hypothetical protein